MTGPGITEKPSDARCGSQCERNRHEGGTSQTTVDRSCELSTRQGTELERGRGAFQSTASPL
jgi:hypothetical protein